MIPSKFCESTTILVIYQYGWYSDRSAGRREGQDPNFKAGQHKKQAPDWTAFAVDAKGDTRSSMNIRRDMERQTELRVAFVSITNTLQDKIGLST